MRIRDSYNNIVIPIQIGFIYNLQYQYINLCKMIKCFKQCSNSLAIYNEVLK